MNRRRGLTITAWTAAAVAVEVYLYIGYRVHEARFHWFTHFFVGASFALLIMAAVTARTGRSIPYPLLWPILSHLLAMFPDILFTAGIAHERWMDIFLGHLSTHFVPGANITWFIVFLASLATYLIVLDRRVPEGARQ